MIDSISSWIHPNHFLRTCLIGDRYPSKNHSITKQQFQVLRTTLNKWMNETEDNPLILIGEKDNLSSNKISSKFCNYVNTLLEEKQNDSKIELSLVDTSIYSELASFMLAAIDFWKKTPDYQNQEDEMKSMETFLSTINNVSWIEIFDNILILLNEYDQILIQYPNSDKHFSKIYQEIFKNSSNLLEYLHLINNFFNNNETKEVEDPLPICFICKYKIAERGKCLCYINKKILNEKYGKTFFYSILSQVPKCVEMWIRWSPWANNCVSLLFCIHIFKIFLENIKLDKNIKYLAISPQASIFQKRICIIANNNLILDIVDFIGSLGFRGYSWMGSSRYYISNDSSVQDGVTYPKKKIEKLLTSAFDFKLDTKQLNSIFSPPQCAYLPCSSSTTQYNCSRCHVLFYCSTKCQKDHWKEHKLYCKSSK